MGAQAPKRQLSETLVKTRVWPRGEDRAQDLSTKSEAECAVGHIDPVGATERFDELQVVVPEMRELVVFANHRGYLRSPVRLRCVHQMSARQIDGRLQIIERAMRPDAEIMKRGGDRDLLQIIAGGGLQGHAQVHDTVSVIPVGGEVGAEFLSVRMQDRIEGRDVLEQHQLTRQEGAGRSSW